MTEREAVRQADWDQRVSDGKLIPLGNGKFRVNEPGSWDDNEVFTEQRTILNGQPMVIAMPDHGLAVKDGKASLYTRQPEWHSVGNVIPEGTSDISEVLRLGGIDFEVAKVPALYRRHGKVLTDPRFFHNVRLDDDESLGVVGTVYVPFQNYQAAAFLQGLVDDHDIIFETAGALRGGSTVFITLKMPGDLIIDEGGLNDPVRQFLAWTNSHDGTGKARVMMTPWRIRCANTNKFALRDARATYGISHSGNLDAKVQDARNALGIAVRYFEEFKVEETQLARTELELAEFDKLIKGLWEPKNEPTKREAGISGRRSESLHSLFESYSSELGRTAYAAEQSVTDWLDHASPRRALNGSMSAARATALLEGSTSDTLKVKTHRQLLTLSNR
jgi:phage/plasmid-like protein (TIGR03299 family)